MHPQFIALGAAILLLSPVNAIGSNLKVRSPKMDLAGGPRFGLPASNEKVAVSHSQYERRDFLGFLSEGGSSIQRKTSTGGGGYGAGSPPQPPYPNGGYSGMRQGGEEDPEDGEDRDKYDEGDDHPDHRHGGQAKRSVVGLLTQPASQSSGNPDDEDSDGSSREAKRSMKARRRELARRGLGRRSVKGDIFKAEMNVDSTLEDAEKLANSVVSRTQSTANGVGSTVSEYIKPKDSSKVASEPAPAASNDNTGKQTTSTTATSQDEYQTMSNAGSDQSGQSEQGVAGTADQSVVDGDAGDARSGANVQNDVETPSESD